MTSLSFAPSGWSASRSSGAAALLAAARAVLENRAFADAALAVLEAGMTTLGADAGLVAACPPGGGELEVVHVRSGDRELEHGVALPSPLLGLCARVASTGRTAFANRLSRSRLEPTPAGWRFPPKNALVAPIFIDGKVVGLLGLMRRPGGFSMADSRVADLFAEMAGAAILQGRALEGLGRTQDALESEVRAGATQLRQAEANFRTLVENLPDVIARFDPDLRHLYVSPSIQGITGRKPESFLGKTHREMGMPAQLAETWAAALQRVFKTGRPERLEYSYPTGEGPVHFDCRLVPEFGTGVSPNSVLTVARDVTERWSALRSMQALSRRLVEAQESERRTIARELHDEAGQSLTSLRIGLRLLEREIAHGGEVGSRVAELVHTTDAVIDGLHRLAADLRPASLDHLGLDAALRQYSREAAAKFGLAVHFKARGFTSERLPAAVETALYRVVQESMTNVVRHAKATRVDILVEHRGDRVMVMIEDDGSGFEPLLVQRADHFGLLGMKERAEALGGTLTLESAPGGGTTIVVEVESVYPNPDR